RACVFFSSSAIKSILFIFKVDTGLRFPILDGNLKKILPGLTDNFQWEASNDRERKITKGWTAPVEC
ncbi:MAG: hypothetical protein LH702_06625, partial [Phormidesmis sp. CAN_BIN44]|nr:hypothetical protein [Phormidesmis sp. CAN_BIN44]